MNPQPLRGLLIRSVFKCSHSYVQFNTEEFQSLFFVTDTYLPNLLNNSESVVVKKSKFEKSSYFRIIVLSIFKSYESQQNKKTILKLRYLYQNNLS